MVGGERAISRVESEACRLKHDVNHSKHEKGIIFDSAPIFPGSKTHGICGDLFAEEGAGLVPHPALTALLPRPPSPRTLPHRSLHFQPGTTTFESRFTQTFLFEIKSLKIEFHILIFG